MLKAFILTGAVFLAVVISMIPSDRAFAQGVEDFLAGDASCNVNPNSEQCICARVRAFGYYPQFVDLGSGIVPEDLDGDGVAPEFNAELGIWEDGVHPITGVHESDGDARIPPSDLFFDSDDDYGQNCSLSYFRENLRRLWYFAAALGGGLAAISITWAGVAYMQNASSGSDLSKNRAMIMRVVVGLVILACSYMIWETASGMFLGHLDTWSLNPDTFYRFNR